MNNAGGLTTFRTLCYMYTLIILNVAQGFANAASNGRRNIIGISRTNIQVIPSVVEYSEYARCICRKYFNCLAINSTYSS